MSKFRNYLLFVGALAVVAAIIGSQARAWSTPEHEDLPVSIELTQISKNPLDLLNQKVTFKCRFASQGNIFRKKDDVFSPENFENFSVWTSEIQFWSKQDLKNAYPTLYILKDNKELINRLRVLERFNKIEIVGVVESVYANMPWIKVESIRVINDDELDQSMASQVTRAVEFVNSGEFQKASICFEIAQERKVPKYVEELITSKRREIENIKSQKIIAHKKHEAEQVLEQARNYAKSGVFEKAATTYGKALKASNEYNTSASIHKEIAGFFIDFYMSKNEISLLDYSINEFKIAQKIIGHPDDDILYALAYIETLKAKLSNDYTKAERLARKCLELNTHHYGGRKLLADIMSYQITNQKQKSEAIILPVAPKKRIKLPKIQSKQEDLVVEIDDLISEQELLTMESEIAEIENSLVEDIRKVSDSKEAESTINKEIEEKIPGLSSDDFKGMLSETDEGLNETDITDEEVSSLLNTELPDFPVSENNSTLPEFAL